MPRTRTRRDPLPGRGLGGVRCGSRAGGADPALERQGVVRFPFLVPGGRGTVSEPIFATGSDPPDQRPLRRIFPLPSSSQSTETFSRIASVIKKSVCGVVPLS